MKALGIVGSPRKGGNTKILTAHCLKAIAEGGMRTAWNFGKNVADLVKRLNK